MDLIQDCIQEDFEQRITHGIQELEAVVAAVRVLVEGAAADRAAGDEPTGR